jgi:hypothetical protein
MGSATKQTQGLLHAKQAIELYSQAQILDSLAIFYNHLLKEFIKSACEKNG